MSVILFSEDDLWKKIHFCNSKQSFIHTKNNKVSIAHFHYEMISKTTVNDSNCGESLEILFDVFHLKYSSVLYKFYNWPSYLSKSVKKCKNSDVNL